MTEQITLKEVKKTVVKIPLYQMLIGIVIAVVFYYLQGRSAAYSAGTGALISALGSLAFALIVTWPFGNSQVLVGRMFKGEIMKFVVIGILFYVAVTNFSFQLMPLLIGFIATLLAFWVALLTSFK
ncbi:ATP synthase subunit I [Marinicella litoralis]|uniref:ATP synthase I subunit n=1 Tax=Marinicella litoralis TaxID=644220 RepID=A0A4R6Y071_9GAMM|nr:ATP synthase subunit I [Marinicella litoralis]TDR23503.1 ATP synthase I subunit [Marinicella litoralis]